MYSRPKFVLEPGDTCSTNTKTPAINPEDLELKKDMHLNQIVFKTDIMSIQENHALT